MTNQEAITFLNSIVPQNVDIVQIDAAKWAEFKTLVLAELAEVDVDPKFKAAVEEVNKIVDSALG